MYIPNDETQKYSSCRLQLVDETFGQLLNEATNQNSVIVPKVVELTNKKTFGLPLPP